VFICAFAHTYIQEYYLAIKKEENSAICNNMGEYGGYYSK
jgi:hypothetical protein